MGADMTRRDTAAERHAFTRPARALGTREPSFTPLARPEQPSATARGLLYAGGLTIAAAALAIGFTGVRPTPRRTPPIEPSPAWARARRRH
jgi:hypothetical protein